MPKPVTPAIETEPETDFVPEPPASVEESVTDSPPARRTFFRQSEITTYVEESEPATASPPKVKNPTMILGKPLWIWVVGVFAVWMVAAILWPILFHTYGNREAEERYQQELMKKQQAAAQSAAPSATPAQSTDKTDKPANP